MVSSANLPLALEWIQWRLFEEEYIGSVLWVVSLCAAFTTSASLAFADFILCRFTQSVLEWIAKYADFNIRPDPSRRTGHQRPRALVLRWEQLLLMPP